MNNKFLVNRLFSPITVLIVTVIFFSIPSFFQNPLNNSYIHDPLFWILNAYWTIALLLFSKSKLWGKKDSSKTKGWGKSIIESRNAIRQS